VCTFEEDESCLFTNDESLDIAKKEMWGFEDGRGVVADNTLRRGLSMQIGLAISYTLITYNYSVTLFSIHPSILFVE